jgi:hypothetical protein
MTGYTFDEQIVSDLHKDARGFRPTQYWWDQWSLCTDAQKQTMWDALSVELEEEMNRERLAKARAMLALTERLEQMYELGAKSEVQALQWIMEAEEFSDYDLQYGADYFCYHFGLDYTEGKKAFNIQQAINQMLSEVV